MPTQHPGCVWQPSWEQAVTKETLTAPPQTLSLPPGPTEPRGGRRAWSERAYPLCWCFCPWQNNSHCPPQNSVVLEPVRLRGWVMWARRKLPLGLEGPGWCSSVTNAVSALLAAHLAHLALLGHQPSSPHLGESLPLRKILKASVNVWKEPQEEGGAVAWITWSSLAPDALRHGLGCPCDSWRGA